MRLKFLLVSDPLLNYVVFVFVYSISICNVNGVKTNVLVLVQ